MRLSCCRASRPLVSLHGGTRNQEETPERPIVEPASALAKGKPQNATRSYRAYPTALVSTEDPTAIIRDKSGLLLIAGAL
jgi:hypothetical protein